VKIALATVGTTGDVRPFAALAAVLTRSGHEVTAVSWELHRETFAGSGAEFRAAGPATTWQDVHDTATRAAATRNPLDQVGVLRDFHLRDADAHYRALRDALPGHELVLLHGVHSLAEAAARDADLPWATAVFDPVLLPTSSAAPAGMPPLGPFNRVGWWLLDRLLRRLEGPLRSALASAGSPSAASVRLFRARSPLLHMVAASPRIAALPPDVPPHTHFTGAWLSPGPPAPLDAAFEEFLSDGPAPVVISFGSMGVASPLEPMLVAALTRAGVRGVLQASSGEAAMAGEVLRIGAADHRALLPRAAALVHHAGAGTTHSAALAGIPQVAVPQIGDQAYWAARVHRLGVAPAPLPIRRLTAESLAARIRNAIGDDAMLARAQTLARDLAAEDGTAKARDLLEQAVTQTA
jgi:UDP:flavonoid glycosyltransferase YjiC (YdhE family)